VLKQSRREITGPSHRSGASLGTSLPTFRKSFVHRVRGPYLCCSENPISSSLHPGTQRGLASSGTPLVIASAKGYE
jgi:hypothetical protein